LERYRPSRTGFSNFRWIVVEKLMQYTIPKMQSVEAKIDFDKLSDGQISILINEITKNLAK